MTSNAEHLNKIIELNDKHVIAMADVHIALTDIHVANTEVLAANQRLLHAQSTLVRITQERSEYLDSVFAD